MAIKIKKISSQIKEAANKDMEEEDPLRGPFLSSGCTMLNLAMTDHPHKAFKPGRYYWFVGDSASGKTFFAMNIFAEAHLAKRFKDHRLIYDNVESGLEMDIPRLFGMGVAERLEPPGGWDDAGNPINSTLIEEFYFNIDDALKDGRPFIYILDSMDGLGAKDDEEKFDEQKKAHKRGRATTGSYGMAKAKKNSTTLRTVISRLSKTDSILIIISQTRDNLGFGFQKNTVGGGRSLKFYATTEIWTAKAGLIKKTVRKKARKIGNKVKLATKKNRITGGEHEVQTAIYPSYGIDDLGSCIDYLMAEKWWSGSSKKVNAKEFRKQISREKLIEWIEQDRKRVKKLQTITGKCWMEIQNACRLKRKSRYA